MEKEPLIISNNNRILYLDIARAIAVLWIVGYWHLRVYCGISYTNPYLSFPGDHYITNVMLGLFMFLSGFFISKYSFDNFKKDTKTFLRKRFLRFYILYSTSALLLYIIGYNSVFGRMCLFTTLTMISSYLLPTPRTLWFFSMLASFYIFTPFILYKRRLTWIVLSFAIIFILVYFLSIILPMGIDTRFYWCFPFYCGGLLIGIKNKMTLFLNHYMCIISLIILTVQLNLLFNYPIVFHYLQYVTLPFGVIFLLNISYYLSFLPIKKSIEFIAYGSMCAYLFHREIYIGLITIYNKLSLDFSYWVSAITFLPIALILSYFIQTIYDKITRDHI